MEISNRFLPLLEPRFNDCESLSDSMNAAILKAAQESIPVPKTVTPNWMQPDTIAVIDSKKTIRKKFGESSNQYKEVKAQSKKLVKRDKINSLNEDLDRIANLSPEKQFFLAVKQLKTTKRNISWGVKDDNGNLLSSKEEILERWASFYENLYNTHHTSEPISKPSETLNLPDITKNEIDAAINKLKSGKSPGLDSIHAEFLKCGGDAMVNILHKLFNMILETGEIPSSFKKAAITGNLKSVTSGNRDTYMSPCVNKSVSALNNQIYHA